MIYGSVLVQLVNLKKIGNTKLITIPEREVPDLRHRPMPLLPAISYAKIAGL